MLFPEMTLKLRVSITIVLATMILLIVGLIRLYWTRHKKYAVILAYLRLVHRIPAGYGVFKPKMSTLLACALEFLSLTWLKKGCQIWDYSGEAIKFSTHPYVW